MPNQTEQVNDAADQTQATQQTTPVPKKAGAVPTKPVEGQEHCAGDKACEKQCAGHTGANGQSQAEQQS